MPCRIILQIRYAHAEVIAQSHERDHAETEPVGRKIAGHKSRQDSQGGPAFLRRFDHFLDVGGFG